ncbi:MAG: type I methionyl aminopeptidase [Planctomycetota bacterium]
MSAAMHTTTAPAPAPLYDALELDSIRRACAFNGELLDFLRPRVVPGVSTAEIDRLAHEYTLDHGHRPAPLGYKQFPAAVCTSVNEVVCHGIPSEGRVLRDGDVINVDATTVVDGWHGDSSEMFLVGDVDDAGRALVQATFDAMHVGIRAARPYGTAIEIGRAVYLFARYHGYGVVREYQGHGVGAGFHEEPGIPHYPHPNAARVVLKPGMVFTVEPMLNEGTWKTRRDKHDKWTVRTKDGKRSAQFEHTIAVTEAGIEILTESPDGPRAGYLF